MVFYCWLYINRICIQLVFKKEIFQQNKSHYFSRVFCCIDDHVFNQPYQKFLLGYADYCYFLFLNDFI